MTPVTVAAKRLTLTTGLLVVCAVGASACGTGLHAQTYKPRAAANGLNQSVGGDVLLRNLSVQSPPLGLYPVGSSAVVTGTLAGAGDAGDTLIGASSPLSDAVTVLGAEGDTVTVPADGTSQTWSVRLDALKAVVQPATYITLTLEFAKAGQTTVSVPVAAPAERLPRPTASAGFDDE